MKSEEAILDLLQYIDSMEYEFNNSILSEKAEIVLRHFEITPLEAERWVSVEKIKELTETQGSKGTWDMDEYMCGMFNGMELCLAILEKRDPRYRDLLTKADES